MKVFMKTVTSATLLEDPSQLDPLLATEGWQTLMTFTRESARELPCSLSKMPLLTIKLQRRNRLQEASQKWTKTFQQNSLSKWGEAVHLVALGDLPRGLAHTVHL